MLAKAIDATDHSKGTVFIMEDITERKAAQDALLREDDTVSRIGGDEFVVVLPNIRSDAAITEVARKVLEALSQPYLIEGHTLSVTPSIGISRYPQDAADAETLISRADDAMYQAKRQGRANARFFVPDSAPQR
jgi:diguanylate cyclase (GGDEF)-like protein